MKKILLFIVISVLTIVQPHLLIASEIPPRLKALHVLNRLGFGPRPGDIKRVNTMGVENYIRQQLFPEKIAEPSTLTRKINKLTTYFLDPNELVEEYGSPARVDGKKLDDNLVSERGTKSQIILREAAEARLMRAIESPRQLQEMMVDFWYNHFNVYAHKDADRLWIGNYEKEAIRPYVLGHFRDLLGATAKHPAMLYYLDNWQNVDPDSVVQSQCQESCGLNENYARELMELHTLGVNGGYTQADVIALTHILTGWGFRPIRRGNDRPDSFEFYFNDSHHDHGDQVFLGQTIKGGGEEEVERVLDILAKSPATARHICFQLAQYFVADNPDPELVNSLARKFEATDGDIRAVLQAIFESPQFWDEKNDNNKFKTPFQYIVSTIRASGEKVTNYAPLINILGQLGMPLYECETPDGYKNTQEAWLNPDGMLRRINFATALAYGTLNINGDRYVSGRLRAMLLWGSPKMMKK